MGHEITTLLERLDYRRRYQLVAAPKRGEPLDPLLDAQVIIEFTTPASAVQLLEFAAKSEKRVPIILGATGWTHEQETRRDELAQTLPVLCAANFSIGILMARTSLDFWAKWPGTDDWSISMKETHHAQKKDAPSGTALSLAETIMKASGRFAPIESIREGEVVGVHEVVFESATERLTLRHEAKSRSVFAVGALEAATRLEEKFRTKSLPPRLLGLEDLYLFSR
jgi:4-hydroxy-tetrahydrodipicolinate reductase